LTEEVEIEHNGSFGYIPTRAVGMGIEDIWFTGEAAGYILHYRGVLGVSYMALDIYTSSGMRYPRELNLLC
jgi:hypothetical protein